MALKDLQIFRTSSCANGHCKGVVKLMNDEIQVECLFPGYIRVTNRELLAVSSKNFYLCLQSDDMILA